jgi:hypothetical protein
VCVAGQVLENVFRSAEQIRNIADDRELAALVEQMRNLAAGVEPNDLRSDDGLRQAWAGELARIESSLASMVIDKPARRITFDD